jgi:predicted KAP-like P-loop ATPase
MIVREEEKQKDIDVFIGGIRERIERLNNKPEENVFKKEKP